MSRHLLTVALILILVPSEPCEGADRRPNVVLIMTDDQGYGDLGRHGNPVIRTPRLDAFAENSLYVPNFYVCPVCSPTRASLLTGRYHYRTGIVDTATGRSMMRPSEATIAEFLSDAGYRTGIFGKWHLGDNFPLRPQDQGFQEVLVHRGGGITQPAGPPGDSYFDPVLLHNGKERQFQGYCSDIFTDGAIEFATSESDRPFFTYLSFNCPHTPLQVADELWKPYAEMDLSKDRFPKVGFPIQGQIPHEETARIYGMVENIDTNVGRLLDALNKASGRGGVGTLATNTIVIFITDNGPQQVRFNAGLRGRKGSVYDGGIRVPCYVRWPDRLEPGEFDGPAMAHIDVLPTLLAACGIEILVGPKLDGVNFLPRFEGQNEPLDRTLYIQWHRGDAPDLYRAFCARGPRYKLVQAEGVAPNSWPAEPKFQLFDIANDPYELKDLAAEHPEIVERMKAGYKEWFEDVGSAGYAPPRIYLGDATENPTTLTRQDMRGPKAGWGRGDHGHWEVSVREAGRYRITLRVDPGESDETASLSIGGRTWKHAVPAAATSVTFEIPDLEPADAKLAASLRGEMAIRGVNYVDVERLGG